MFASGEETWYAHFKCTKTTIDCDGRQSKVHSGVMISDRTLIDNKDMRDKMVSSTSPEAIGREMEGVTLVGIQRNLAKKKRKAFLIILALQLLRVLPTMPIEVRIKNGSGSSLQLWLQLIMLNTS